MFLLHNLSFFKEIMMISAICLQKGYFNVVNSPCLAAKSSFYITFFENNDVFLIPACPMHFLNMPPFFLCVY